VLGGEQPPAVPLHELRPAAASLAWAIAGTLGAAAVALALLYRGRLPQAVLAAGARVALPVLTPLRLAHSGHVRDYVAWLTLGTGAIGVVLALTLT
jgi:multicomponent Na+:H+ antiporter subunit D